MIPLLLAAEALPIPEGNLGKILALLLLLAMIVQPIVTRLLAQRVTEKQTAVIQTGTDAQTVLIVGSLEDVRHEMKRMREAQEKADQMSSMAKIEAADTKVRMGEFKVRIDNHDTQLLDHQVQLVDLREQVHEIKKAGR